MLRTWAPRSQLRHRGTLDIGVFGWQLWRHVRVGLSLSGVISIPRSGWVPFRTTFSAITGPELLSDTLHCSRVRSKSSIRGRSNFAAAAAAAVQGGGSNWTSISFGCWLGGIMSSTIFFVGSCNFFPPTCTCGSCVNVSRMCLEAAERSAGSSPHWNSSTVVWCAHFLLISRSFLAGASPLFVECRFCCVVLCMSRVLL
jgi:hypothetical protein